MQGVRRAIWLTLFTATVALSGCAAAPSGMSGAGKTVERSQVAAGSDSVTAYPGTGPGGTLRLPPGIYLASFITLEFNSNDFPVPIAFGPNAGTFYAGDITFTVVNKWGGLAAGAHKMNITILAPDGQAELATDHTDFSVRADQIFFTIVVPLRFTAPTPGYYQVMVSLDGMVVARYQFQVVTRAADGSA